MGLIINPRGAGGSGKTELVRRILEKYGWIRGASCSNTGIELINRPGRGRPFGYHIRHPGRGRPLVVLGDYEVTSGGCDTIPIAHGGLEEIARSADAFATAGHDVLIEGLALGADVKYSMALARTHDLRIIRLSTPVDQCARNLVSRRRMRRDLLPQVERTTAMVDRHIEGACQQLRAYAHIEVAAFEDALARALSLLGIGAFEAA
ncbi:hypothetical protein [Rhodoligotrophos defluvii]|uniref:hypothetical protein n=1 Tax=Rhodoligotrophos defluvii TaxID=2561934 RepID=UPI0010C9A46A|nr:hypothetical protein [Rhodoligotrophos defluvii]